MEAQNLLTTKDKELTTLRQQLSLSEEERERREEENAALSQSLKQLKDDLATMTTENQRVHEELRRVASEKENTKRQVKEYHETVVKYQQELTGKVELYSVLVYMQVRERRRGKREEKLKEDGGMNLLYIVQTVCNKGTCIQCTCTILVYTHNYFL